MLILLASVWQRPLFSAHVVSCQFHVVDTDRRLAFEQSIESLYATDNPHLRDFLASRSTFGGDEFLIVAYSEPELFQPDVPALTEVASDRIETFAEQLSKVPGVASQSTQHLAQALRFLYGRERIKEMVSHILVGDDDHTTAIVLRLRPEKESPVSRGETIAAVRKLADAHDPPAMVVGEPAQIHDMFRYVEEDGRKLFLVSLALLAIVLTWSTGCHCWASRSCWRCSGCDGSC
ncbi:MAG: integral membrane protein [Planctomycetota bacterium]|nr:MAG: integral membrane protein [Planctomycetota bacterium]